MVCANFCNLREAINNLKNTQKMTFKDDILAKITIDFGENADTTTKLLVDAISKSFLSQSRQSNSLYLVFGKWQCNRLGKTYSNRND